jgi:hypothetical protein
MSFGQRRLWFLSQLEPESASYNTAIAVRMKGRVDHRLLVDCFNRIVERHEVLRTSFSTENGEPVQIIATVGRVTLETDLVANQPEAILAAARDEAQRPFNLQQAPLLRLRLFDIADDDHLLVVTLHHIVCDGWSPDLLRFMKTTMLEGTVNQVHKIVTPLNTSQYDYCTGVQNTYCNGNADEFIPTPSAAVACFQSPAFTLSTMPWNNGNNNYSSCTAPIVCPAPDGVCGGYGKVEMSSSSPAPTLSLYPNPTSNHTTLQYNTNTDETATVTLLDLSGKTVAINNEYATAGSNEFGIATDQLPAGIYLVRLQTPTQSFTERLVIAR